MKARDGCILWDQWSGLHSLAPSETKWSGPILSLLRPVIWTQLSSTCFVYLSRHPFALLAASRNVATSQHGHRVLACLCMGPEDPGDATMWKWLAWRLGFFHENFSQFYPLFRPQKATFQSCLAWSPFRWPPFEHSSSLFLLQSSVTCGASVGVMWSGNPVSWHHRDPSGVWEESQQNLPQKVLVAFINKEPLKRWTLLYLGLVLKRGCGTLGTPASSGLPHSCHIVRNVILLSPCQKWWFWGHSWCCSYHPATLQNSKKSTRLDSVLLTRKVNQSEKYWMRWLVGHTEVFIRMWWSLK